jgi:hypothetical protein
MVKGCTQNFCSETSWETAVWKAEWVLEENVEMELRKVNRRWIELAEDCVQ